MRLSNNAKQQLAINLLSDYLIKNGFEHIVFSSDKSFDLYIPSSETRIKVFCNYSNVKYLKVPGNFEAETGVLYLVVKPTRKNTHGFSSLGGYKEVIDKSIHIMNEKRFIKNIEIESLKSISTKKCIENDRDSVEKRDIAAHALSSRSTIYRENIMPYNIELTDKCKELLLDDYEEFREHGKPNTPVEDEMLRHFLDMARKEGLVKSFSKKVMTVLEA
jgi:hypothetical protein